MKGPIVLAIGGIILFIGIVLCIVPIFMIDTDYDDPSMNSNHELLLKAGVPERVRMTPGDYEIWYRSDTYGMSLDHVHVIQVSTGEDVFNTNRTRSYDTVTNVDEEYTRIGTFPVDGSGEYEYYSTSDVRLYITPPLEDNEPPVNNVALGMCCVAMTLLVIAPIVMIIGVVIWVVEHKKKPTAKSFRQPTSYPVTGKTGVSRPSTPAATSPPKKSSPKKAAAASEPEWDEDATEWEEEDTTEWEEEDSAGSVPEVEEAFVPPSVDGSAWERFAADLGGIYQEDGLLRMPMVTVRFQDWSIYLDALSQERLYHTRIRALYINQTGFKWSIHRKGELMDIKDTLALQKEPRAFKDFHPEFVIRSNDKKKAKLLFSNPRIKKLLVSQPDVFFASERPDFLYIQPLPADSRELFFVSPGMIDDGERLKELFDVFKETLATMDMLDL